MTEIKVEVLDKYDLDFFMKNENNLSGNGCVVNNKAKRNQKKKRYNSVLNNSLAKDRRVSNFLATEKRNSQISKDSNKNI